MGQMEAVLVTGVAGFIGSHVAEALLSRGTKVIGIDNLNDYYSRAIKKGNIELLSRFQDFTFLKGDITDRSFISQVEREARFCRIAHLAARAGVRPSIEDPFVYQEVNVRGTLNLLELARKVNVENFVLTSSSSVYGNSRDIPFREDDNATDRPISPYAATKKASEILGYTYHSLYNLNINVIRPFTVYGPRGRPDMAPYLFIDSAIRGKPLRKFGDGTTRRDYTFIGDFVSGFLAAIDRAFGYEIFNLGNSETVSLNEFLDIVSEVTGKELNIIQEAPQAGDVELTNADISKAERLLSYHPQTSFKEGMSVFYQWYLSEQNLL